MVVPRPSEWRTAATARNRARLAHLTTYAGVTACTHAHTCTQTHTHLGASAWYAPGPGTNALSGSGSRGLPLMVNAGPDGAQPATSYWPGIREQGWCAQSAAPYRLGSREQGWRAQSAASCRPEGREQGWCAHSATSHRPGSKEQCKLRSIPCSHRTPSGSCLVRMLARPSAHLRGGHAASLQHTALACHQIRTG